MKDPAEVQLKAHDAQKILDDPVMKEVHFNLRKRYFDTLLAEPVGSLTAQQQHAKLLALEDVFAELKSFITDEKMRTRR